MTVFAFLVQEHCNKPLGAVESLTQLRLGIQDEDDDQSIDEKEQELNERVFVLGEMLKMMVLLDFSDEIGRRKVFGFIRAFIIIVSVAPLPHGID